MHRGVAILLLAACSGASGASPRAADHRREIPDDPHTRHTHAQSPPIGGIDEKAPVPACPPETELAARLREQWEVPPDATLDVVACARGRFPRPGWLVAAFIDTADDESEQRIEVIAADGGGAIAALADGSAPAFDRFDTGAGDGWEAADLDADGTDELLQVEEWFQTAVRSTTLAVFRIDGAALREVGRLRLAFDNHGAKAISAPRIVTCSSQHALSDGGDGTRHILVQGTVAVTGRQAASTAASNCPLPGTHRYRLIDGKLDEVKP